MPIEATGNKYTAAGFTVGVSHVTWVPGTKKKNSFFKAVFSISADQIYLCF